MKDPHHFFFHVRRIPRHLFHVSPASAAVVLIVTLLALIPVFIDLLRGWLK